MRTKHFFFNLFVAGFTLTTVAQDNDPVIMWINGREIKKSEFEAVYHKNSGRETGNNSKSISEYVDLFTLYKSKVFEAESLGLDTLLTFRNELEGYRKQLAAPYLTDKNTNESLLNEAYERLKTEIKASHILVRIEETALPKDTLEAWTRINIIREAVLGKLPTAAEISNYDKLLKNSTDVAKQLGGKDSTLYKIKINSIKELAANLKNAQDKFQDLAPKISDDISAHENKGNLNYFSAFDMVYPFECAAFNTKPGEISKVVRTRFGYHILKVYDTRNNRGEITVTHIMTKFPKNPTDQDKTNARQKIDEIYGKLKSGQNFEDLARQFSDDRQSAERGGLLPPFKGGRYAAEFEAAAFSLKANGDYTEPVLTAYGWHIIKRVDLKEVASFDAMRNELKNRVSRDSRSQKGRAALIERVKRENAFKENLKARDEFYKVVDSSYLKATWRPENAAKLGNKEMFNLSGRSYTQNDFAKFLETQMTFRSPTDLSELVKGIYRTWVEERVVAFEDAQLDKKYRDFANLYREYRDGILLFDLTDQKVWSKAVKDTAGLKAFYESNKSKYMWGERADVTIYKCLNDKLAKEVRKMLKDKKDEKQIVEALNKTSQLNVTVDNIWYAKGENKYVDATWKTGVAEKDFKDDKENKVLVVVVNKIMPSSPKALNECRGNATADYQNSLDTEWINYLKNKYKAKINQEVLNSVK